MNEGPQYILDPRAVSAERVWVPPVTKMSAERVWVVDRYEYRTITRWVDGHCICERLLVLVQPGHFETRWREIVTVPGYWETVVRQSY